MILAQPESGVGKGEFADIRAFNEDGDDMAIVGLDGLIDEIQDALFDRPVFLVSEADLHALAPVGLAGPVHLVKMLEKLVSLEFRKGFADGLSNDLPVSDQPLVGRIGQFEDVVWSLQQRHEARSLLEHLRQDRFQHRPIGRQNKHFVLAHPLTPLDSKDLPKA